MCAFNRSYEFESRVLYFVNVNSTEYNIMTMTAREDILDVLRVYNFAFLRRYYIRLCEHC